MVRPLLGMKDRELLAWCLFMAVFTTLVVITVWRIAGPSDQHSGLRHLPDYDTYEQIKGTELYKKCSAFANFNPKTAVFTDGQKLVSECRVVGP